MKIDSDFYNYDFTSIKPVNCGYEDCKPGQHFGPAVRTNWLIHYVVSGFGKFKINGAEYTLSQGEMFVIPPYVETCYEADADNPWEYIWIGFEAYGNLPIHLADTIYCPEAAHVFNKIKTCEDGVINQMVYLSARIYDLFYLLLKPRKSDRNYMERALEYIHAEYMNKLTVENIADYLNIDRKYFADIFKKKIGVSPKQYLLNYRLSIAADLIVNKNISVTVAANSVGYNDIYTFSKMFKKHFGVSPTEYAKQKHSD